MMGDWHAMWCTVTLLALMLPMCWCWCAAVGAPPRPSQRVLLALLCIGGEGGRRGSLLPSYPGQGLQRQSGLGLAFQTGIGMPLILLFSLPTLLLST